MDAVSGDVSVEPTGSVSRDSVFDSGFLEGAWVHRHQQLFFVDWTTRGALMLVNSNKQCRRSLNPSKVLGFIATGNLSPLSEQQLVDGDTVDSTCQKCLAHHHRQLVHPKPVQG